MNNDNQKIGFFKSYGLFWKNYVNFTGSSTRSEYWWPMLINIIIGLVAVVLFTVLLLSNAYHGFSTTFIIGIIIAIILGIYVIAIIIPLISLHFRRYHDAGISAWWLLLTIALPRIFNLVFGSHAVAQGIYQNNSIIRLIAWVCTVANIVICVLPSNTTNNKYRK